MSSRVYKFHLFVCLLVHSYVLYIKSDLQIFKKYLPIDDYNIEMAYGFSYGIVQPTLNN